MTDTKLTPRQKQILIFIVQHNDKHGFPPTRAELCEHFGFRSPNAAESHLKALERKQVLHIERGRSRGLRLADAAAALLPARADARLQLPLVGRVAAGRPILAEENVEDQFRVDPALFSPRPHYLLRVHGDSMLGAGIHDGDLLAVHRTPEAHNGQLVVARLGDEVTVKHFRRSGHRVRLLPANPDFEPLEIDLRRQELVIEGLGVGVIRRQLEP
ncbi:MAG: transcriptional repressor LexA [Xanthomonadales bacterium]|nr:transcriptional repressor LexA [Xanthomonadales bacterium]